MPHSVLGTSIQSHHPSLLRHHPHPSHPVLRVSPGRQPHRWVPWVAGAKASPPGAPAGPLLTQSFSPGHPRHDLGRAPRAAMNPQCQWQSFNLDRSQFPGRGGHAGPGPAAWCWAGSAAPCMPRQEEEPGPPSPHPAPGLSSDCQAMPSGLSGHTATGGGQQAGTGHCGGHQSAISIPWQGVQSTALGPAAGGGSGVALTPPSFSTPCSSSVHQNKGQATLGWRFRS